MADNFADAAGGGLSTAGRLRLVQSTVSYNGAGTQAGPAQGGGIHVESSGHAELENSTVSSNSVFSGEYEPQGGGVYTTGAFSLEHVTIAGNTAEAGAGLFQARPTGEPMSMHNTLLAGNLGPACGGTPGIIVESNNLSDDTTCELEGDLEGVNPGILGLDDHGGPTDTHALEPQSAAIDAAANDRCLPVDQRGFARRDRDACDIGAVERRPSPVVNTTLDGDDGSCDPDDCTLREALEDSERDAVIVLPEGEYGVELGELELRGSRSILGSSARTTALVANGGHRVLSVVGGDSLLSGVRIAGGDAGGGQGGGILVSGDAALSVVDSTVAGNSAAAGGGIANLGALVVTASTIASNQATDRGGGLLIEFPVSASLINSTVSRNVAGTAGGGIANLAGRLDAVNATIASNQAPSGGGVFGDAELIDGSMYVGESNLTSTILAANTGGACAWTPEHDRFTDHSLADDESCFEADNGNLVEADPGIGPLSSNFGPTDVHPLLAGSPAIDAGNGEFCAGTDQRGAPRTVGPECDIGAFEFDDTARMLRVVTDVLDGPAKASDFTVRVHSGGQPVGAGPGSASGTPFALTPGTYRVTYSGPDGYVRTFSEGCDARGDVVVPEGQDATCRLTLDHVTAPDGGCLDYPAFGQSTGLNLLGDAAVAGSVLRLNPDAGGVGAAWFGARMPVADGFTTDFEFRITPPGGGADGLAFVIQNHALDALGISGGGLGYHELPNSLAVEFDTWWNPEYGEPSENHVSVHSRGTQPNNAGPDGQLGPSAALPSFKDGELHRVRLVYVPGRLDVFVDDMTAPKLSVDVDLANLLQLQGGAALVGFTAATGGVTEGHRIDSWHLCSAERPAADVPTQGSDPPPPPPEEQEQEQAQELPPPEAGEDVNALPKSGTVRVKVEGSNRFVELEQGRQIPVGSVRRHHQGPGDPRSGGRPAGGLLRRRLPDRPGQGREAADHAHAGAEAQLSQGGQGSRGGQEEEAAAVGRRQRQVQDGGQAQRGDRGRDQVAGRGSMHEHADQGRAREGEGARFRQEEDGDRARRQAVRGTHQSLTDRRLTKRPPLGQDRGALHRRNGIRIVLLLVLALAIAPAGSASAQTLAAPFDGSYSVQDLGQVPGVPDSLGGLTFKTGTTDRLLIGGQANDAAGALYEIGVVRDGAGHIVGFTGAATRFADAANNDGGVTYGPGGVLFLARWPLNELGQTKPGSTITDKIVPLTPLGIESSLASLQFVPQGQPGAGSLKLASYRGGGWYDADVVADGAGTYDLVNVREILDSRIAGGPEGFVYVPSGSPQFSGPSMLISEYGVDEIAAYQVDANGDPVIGTRRSVITGLDGAEGALLDPLTGDFLFSTFGGGSRVVAVRGFRAPAAQLPPPRAGKTVNAYVVRGKVRIKLRGKKKFVELEAGQQIPVGTTVDTTKGRVTIVAAGEQTADFYDGVFKIAQNSAAKPLTTLKLVEKLRCPSGGRASVAAKGKKKRRLWGDGSGKFKTEGKHSAATVVGTKWLVEDRCKSTTTRVTSGVVSVRDFAKRKTVTVRAGKKYVAKAKR